MKARERVGCVGPLDCPIGRDETIEHQGGSVIFASVHGNVQRRANPKSNRSVWLTTDPAAEDVHQRSRLNGAKLTGVEELAIADRTRLVPHATRPPIEHPNHWRMTPRDVHAALLVPARQRHGTGRIQQVDALVRVYGAAL